MFARAEKKMKRNGKKRVCRKQSCDRVGEVVDRFRDLPECLIFEILLNLPTKDVVKTSVLSKRWRNLWRYVPGLDLECRDFSDHNSTVSFVDRFLCFNSICKFKFTVNWSADVQTNTADYTRWINTVLEKKVHDLHVLDQNWARHEVKIPQTVFTCESLVSLKLCYVILANPGFVSLPSLKVLVLDNVEFADNLQLLISGCPVLESFFLEGRALCDETKVFRVCSQSLLSFTYVRGNYEDMTEDLIVAIDAPRLEYLKLAHFGSASFILNKTSSLVKADIHVLNLHIGKRLDPNDLPKRNMIRDFFIGISTVKHMIISTYILEVLYDYCRCEQLPLFCNLCFLRVTFSHHEWEMLPIFLHNCPNLKSLVLDYITYLGEGISITSEPWCLLSSLEYVELERPLKGKAMEMKLVSYLLENSKILKKLSLHLDSSIKSSKKSVIFKELLSIPRLSSSCRVVVL